MQFAIAATLTFHFLQEVSHLDITSDHRPRSAAVGNACSSCFLIIYAVNCSNFETLGMADDHLFLYFLKYGAPYGPHHALLRMGFPILTLIFVFE
nr:hypothetical protein [Tanacetum cinerariifolium]